MDWFGTLDASFQKVIGTYELKMTKKYIFENRFALVDLMIFCVSLEIWYV